MTIGTQNGGKLSRAFRILQILLVFGVSAALLPTESVSSSTPDSWSIGPSMHVDRFHHTATLLNDGTVLVAGGWDGTAPSATAEIYDPVENTWTLVGSMTDRRYRHTATLLLDGRVLVLGGWNNSIVTSAEIFDPESQSWSMVARPNTPRAQHTATLLNDGRVLVVGGNGGGFSPEFDEVYDPKNDTWKVTASSPNRRTEHVAVLLDSGRVLVTGGFVGHAADHDTSTEIYDPVTETWTTSGSMAFGRAESMSATRLADGRVLVAGGSVFRQGYVASAEVFDPATDSWQVVGPMSTARGFHTATLLDRGHVLVVGGGGSGAARSAEIFDPYAGTWYSARIPQVGRLSHTATLLNDGRVLIAGGHHNGLVSRVELYTPPHFHADLFVELIDVPAQVALGDEFTYTIRISHNGGIDATGVVLTDSLSDAVEIVSATSEQGACTVARPVVCTIDTLAVGAQATVEITVSAVRSGQATHAVHVTADEPDPDESGNTDKLQIAIMDRMWIDGITVSSSRQDGVYVITAEIAVDSTAGLVDGADVAVIWSNQDGFEMATTASAEGGVATFHLPVSFPGTYVATVTGVTRQDFVYNPAENTQTSNSITIGSPLHVERMNVYLRPTPSTTRIFTRVEVMSGNSVIAGATVHLRLTNPNGTTTTYRANTNASGYVMLAHAASGPGTYIAEVLDVAKDGHTYEPEANKVDVRGLRIR